MDGLRAMLAVAGVAPRSDISLFTTGGPPVDEGAVLLLARPIERVLQRDVAAHGAHHSAGVGGAVALDQPAPLALMI